MPPQSATEISAIIQEKSLHLCFGYLILEYNYLERPRGLAGQFQFEIECMWILQPDAEYQLRAKNKDWSKKHRREFEAVHNNLDTIVKSLQHGAKVEEVVKAGYVHHEPRGVIAVDQKGGGGGLKETRLYVFLDKINQVVHVITLGDKHTQKVDIQYASAFVERLERLP